IITKCGSNCQNIIKVDENKNASHFVRCSSLGIKDRTAGPPLMVVTMNQNNLKHRERSISALRTPTSLSISIVTQLVPIFHRDGSTRRHLAYGHGNLLETITIYPATIMNFDKI